MADIVIINPSSNMKTLARELSAYGKTVKYVSVSDIPYVFSKRVFYFFPGRNICFSEDAKGGVEKEDRIFVFKRGIFSSVKMWGLSKDLEKVDKGLSRGIFSDLIIFCRGMLLHDNHKEDIKSFTNIEAVSRAYPDANIISAFLPGGNTLKLCRWETDYDLAVTFSSDYFIFFDGSSRTEAFCYNGALYTLSKASDHISNMSNVIPTFSKFTFKKTDEKNITRNVSPWITKSQTLNITLLNDYSFFGTSIDMPSSWYSRLASIINNQKKR